MVNNSAAVLPNSFLLIFDLVFCIDLVSWLCDLSVCLLKVL